MISWELDADSYTNCNCAYGCPCQFNALPTYGNCEAIHSMEIKTGHFGDVNLDGLRAVSTFRWPGPIHEGGGKAFTIIDERANEAQRKALLTILSGQETDPGATIWNVFSATYDEVMEPAFLPIDIEIDIAARKSSVSVEGYIKASGTPILNPVSGEEHQAQIQLNNGFEYSVAEMGAGTATATGPIPLDLVDSYGQFNKIHINNHGVIKH
ncbi:MAG: DUF1326 domain-containing protein [Halieaceae bacterium]|jgi:hypothetical protein|nr:DUF1326 domain-containing protein [Halieaceae bacterium]